MSYRLKAGEIDFEEIQLTESELSEATLPRVLQAVPAQGKRKRSFAALQKRFVSAWKSEACAGTFTFDDAAEFVASLGLAADNEMGHKVLGNTAEIVLKPAILNLWTGERTLYLKGTYRQDTRMQVSKLLGRDLEYAILDLSEWEQPGYELRDLPPGAKSVVTSIYL